MNSHTLLSKCPCSFVELDWFVHFDESPQVGDLSECLDGARLVDDERAAVVSRSLTVFCGTCGKPSSLRHASQL